MVGTNKYKFDAVIMHTYYEPDNWQRIPLDYLIPVDTCVDSASLWQYDIADNRLTPTFDTLTGLGNQINSFKWFLTRNDTASYMASMDEFNH